MLVNIQAKLSEGKSEGYARWAKKYNLKEMSKTLIFLQEHKIGSTDELNERAAAATEKYHQLGDSIKAAETRMAEIAVLKRTSSITPRPTQSTMPTGKRDIAKSFWILTGKKSHCTK